MLTLREVATLCGGRLVAAGGCECDERLAMQAVDTVSTDSRALPPAALFVALTGEHFDAHAFIDDLAATAVVATRPSLGVPTIVVADTRRALGDLAVGWRRRFTMPLVTVTGSNGKTTTKEMVAAIFAAAYGADQRLATRGNLNNEIGVPLTVLGLRSQHRAAVVEVGMNHPLETARLAEIAGPTIALVVNAQREHQEFMQSVAAVADEHALSIAASPLDGIAVFPADDAHADVWRRAASGRRVVDFVCATEGDDLIHAATVVGRARLERDGVMLHLTVGTDMLDARLAVPGLHNARNATAAAAVALAAGVPLGAIRQGLEAFAPVGGRSQRLVLDDGTTLIDDSYNANPDSMRAAIDLLASHAGSQRGSRLLVMGDMGEVGDAGPRFHEEIGLHARERGIEALYALGDASRGAVDAFGSGARHFPAVEPLIAEVATWVRDSHGPRAIVVKGSRFMRMERVVASLAAALVDSHGEAH